MTLDEIKQAASTFIDDFNRGDVDAIENHLSADFIQHSPGVPPSREAFFVFLKACFEAYTGARFVIEDMIAEEQKVLLRWTFYGKHTGQWMGRDEPPTGKDIHFTGMDLWRYDDDGKLAEAWFIGDMLGLMRQLDRITFK